MTWTCPKCRREFSKTDQSHSCDEFTVNEHFSNRPKWLFDLFNRLVSTLGESCEFKIDPVKTAILLKRKTSFAGIKVQNDYLQIHFALDKTVDEFPVYKTIKYTKNRWIHYIKLDSPDEIDHQLISWLMWAYKLV